MLETELIAACVKNDKSAKKHFFELYYGTLAYIALRYSKNKAQAEIIINEGFLHLFNRLQFFKSQDKKTLEDFIKHEFISFVVNYIRSIRNEYYVASTVKATERIDKSYDLFLDNTFVDLKNINPEILLKSIQELVPSQRLIFNLYIIDGYTLSISSDLLDTSEQTLKSNIEKARFNLQKSIEKNLKLV